ncbi:hypothetical protein [Plantactinospora sonchi]|uniref:DUF4399 domain-containing protein n=1 Tax=Plantactinospora sonchi TaxID=1544735 RepID=A0ABU7RNJ2_9ACTN
MPSQHQSRKVRAEAARAAMQRARRRERRQHQLFWGIGGGLVAALLIAVALVVVLNRPGAGAGTAAAPAIPATPPATAEGRTDQPPWPVPADPTARVRAAGLPMLGAEGTVEHIHAHLDVIVDGKPVPVPAEVGIDEAGGGISPLHTHDTTGVLHIESPVKADFSLGQFFTEWQVALSQNQLGGLTAGDGKVLRAYVNGTPYSGDPAGIVLHAHDEVALVYGTPDQQANPPSSYTFPDGL